MVKKAKSKAKKAKKAKNAGTKNTKSVRKTDKVKDKKTAIKKKPSGAARHPDKRLPGGDPGTEILCKWSTADNRYICKEVPIGGDWP
jgi:hypothetical protein